MIRILSIIITAFLLLSCSSEKPADTRKSPPQAGAIGASTQAELPVISGEAACAVELYPKAAVCQTTLNLIATGFNPSEAKVEWLVNGARYPTAEPNRFSGADIRKGDTVQARVFVRDREVLSDPVLIMNAPPQIARVKLLPEVFKPGDNLSIEAEGKDMDGDVVALLYEWDKNGAPAGTDPGIETSLKRGDKVSVKITPFDGEDYGVPVVLHREISNLPPVITEHREFTFDGKAYAYQLKAADPDEDALAYSLKSAPDGMSIDQSTGLIKWPVPAEFKGDAEATAVVDDGHGGTARYEIKITIK